MNCRVDGCDVVTRDHKTVCPDHIAHEPYVAEVIAELARRDKELTAVARRGARAVATEGAVANEMLMHLNQAGPQTIRRLAKDYFIGCGVDVAEAYAHALAKAGRVTLSQGVRGHTVVQAA